MVQFARVKDAVGVPTPPNSGSELSSRKADFTAMLESMVGCTRRPQEDQDLILSMNTTSTDSLEARGYLAMNVSCKRVCVGRVETMVGLDGSTVHVTEEADGAPYPITAPARQPHASPKAEDLLSPELPPSLGLAAFLELTDRRFGAPPSHSEIRLACPAARC
ncbi:hypothetical protein ZWY2020_001274 [Hordeum vulgare]|nr:hypothetical protein ZWY2020_001274 [Hordeum vulgare]